MGTHINISLGQLYSILEDNNYNRKTITSLKKTYYSRIKAAEKEYNIDGYKLHYDLIADFDYLELNCYDVNCLNPFTLSIYISNANSYKASCESVLIFENYLLTKHFINLFESDIFPDLDDCSC